MANQGTGINQEALERLQSIIRSLQNEKDSLARRLANANRDRIVEHEATDLNDQDDTADYRENYIYMKESGVLFSSSKLA